MKKIEQEKVDEDFFDTLKEEFLDEVYGSESKLTRADYMDHLSKRQAWIFSSIEVREKLHAKI